MENILNKPNVVYDNTILLEITQGDNEFITQILEEYIDNIKNQYKNLNAENCDFNNIRIIAHTIKGTSLTVGAINIANCSLKLEHAAKINNKIEIDKLIIELDKHIIEFLSKITYKNI
jgi:HPt (histidine-containing phosphotransfer) domain-containing protein